MGDCSIQKFRGARDALIGRLLSHLRMAAGRANAETIGLPGEGRAAARIWTLIRAPPAILVQGYL